MSGEVDDREGMFEPFSDAELSKAKRAAPVGMGEKPGPIVPASVNAPDPDWRRLRPPKAKGEPVGTWIYLTADGAIAFYVVRWKNVDPQGRKIIRPVSWIGDRWAIKAMPSPRPPYNLPEILESSTRPFVVVEGEKCADAAARVFPDCTVTTWAGGTKAWAKTDWRPVTGREILLVADADEPGHAAMHELAAHLAATGCTVRLFLPPGEDGHDIADAVDIEGPERGHDRIGRLRAMRGRIQERAIPWKPEATGLPEKSNAPETADTREGKDAPNPIETTGTADTSEPAGETDASETPNTKDTPDNINWIERLLEQAKTDPGAPFEHAFLKRLSELKHIDKANWERLRAKLRGTKVRIGELEKELKIKRQEIDRSSFRGRRLEWEVDELWPDAVDSADLLDSIAKLFRGYVHMSEAQVDTLALFIVYLWVHDKWDISTFLGVTSATKRCGKSLLMELIEELAPRPLNMSGHTTSAALFRLIEENQPTLLLDEADTYLRDDLVLRGLINGSQRRSGAQTVRSVKVSGDDWEVTCFSTFCPKAFAGIGSLPDTIRDRSIVIDLERREQGETKMPH